MSNSNLLKIVDRIALGWMNGMVMVGLPLFAIGMVIRSL